jgi:hypothetical protein
MKKYNRVAAVVLAGALSLGTVATANAAGTTIPTTPGAGNSVRPNPDQELATVLAKLVTAGTITQAQSDAITAAVKAAKPTPPAGAKLPHSDTNTIGGAPAMGGFPGGKGGPGGMGGFGMGRGGMGGFGMGRGGMGGFGMNTAARQSVITSFLGTTAAALQTSLQSGKSLAQLATAAGKAPADLITALVNYDNAQIDAQVTAGTLTSAQATALKANVTKRDTNEVNNVRPAFGAAPAAPSAKTSAYHTSKA